MIAPFNFELILDFHADWIKFIKLQLEQLPTLQKEDYIDIPEKNWLIIISTGLIVQFVRSQERYTFQKS